MESEKGQPSFSGRYNATPVPVAVDSDASICRPRLGDLLIGADLISDRTFYECLLQAEQSAQPVGKVIVSYKYASDQDIDSALLIQSLIADKKIKPSVGRQILKEAARQRIAVVDLLRTVSTQQTAVQIEKSYLGKFLFDCKLIGSDQLAQAVAVSQEFNVQLVRVLLHNGSLSVALASKTLDALARVKSGKLDYQVAVTAIGHAQKTGASLQDVLRSCGVTSSCEPGRMLLGEIIGRAKIASEIEILTAVEMSLSQGKMLGEALISAGAITPLTLQNALELQDLIASGVIQPDEALWVLKNLVLEHRSLAEFSNSTGMFRNESEFYREILNVLYSSSIIPGGEVVAAFQEKSEYGMDSVRALLATGRLPFHKFLLVKDAYYMIRDHRVTPDVAYQALRIAYSDELPFYQALKGAEPHSPSLETMISPPTHKESVKGMQVPEPAALSNWWQKIRGMFRHK